MGQLVGQDFDAASVSQPLGSPIEFLSPCRMMHAWHWRSTLWSTFRTSADCWMLTVLSSLASVLRRQAIVEGVSTATEYSAGLQPISSFVFMHTWRCATSRRGHREV